MGYLIKQNQTARPLVFLLVDATDHVTPLTGLSPTVTLSKNGAAFVASAGVVSEIGNGWYKVAGNAADSDTLGPLLLHATAAGADPTDDRFDVVAADPHEARVDVGKWLGTAVATPNVNGVPLIDIGYVIGQPASTTSGPIDANVTQVAGQVASAAGAVDFGNLDSAVSSRSTLDAAGVWSHGARTLSAFGFGVTVTANTDKTGYALAPDGLDTIPVTAPNGPATTFRGMVVQTWRRFFKKSVLDAAQLRTFADDGVTVLTTQPATQVGTVETQGAAT